MSKRNQTQRKQTQPTEAQNSQRAVRADGGLDIKDSLQQTLEIPSRGRYEELRSLGHGVLTSFADSRGNTNLAARATESLDTLNTSPKGMRRGKAALILAMGGALGAVTPQGQELLGHVNDFVDNQIERNDNKNIELPKEHPSQLIIETDVPAPVDALGNQPANGNGAVPGANAEQP